MGIFKTGVSDNLSNLTSPTEIGVDLLPVAAENIYFNNTTGTLIPDYALDGVNIIEFAVKINIADSIKVSKLAFKFLPIGTGQNTFARIRIDGGSEPGMVIGTSQSQTITSGGDQLVVFNFTSPVQLSAGTDYWFTINNSTGPNIVLYSTTSGYELKAYSVNSGVWLGVSGSSNALALQIITSQEPALGSLSSKWKEVYASSLLLPDADSSNYVGFTRNPTVGPNVIWTLPGADGTSGQVLTTDGSGNLSWSSSSGGESATFNGDKVINGSFQLNSPASLPFEVKRTGGTGWIAEFNDGSNGILFQTDSNYCGFVGFTAANGYNNIDIRGSVAPQIRLNTDGRIGLGINNPTEKVQIDGGNLSLTGNLIKNVADPVDAQDVATKNWVLNNSGGPAVIQTGAKVVIPTSSQDFSVGLVQVEFTNANTVWTTGQAVVQTNQIEINESGFYTITGRATLTEESPTAFLFIYYQRNGGPLQLFSSRALGQGGVYTHSTGAFQDQLAQGDIVKFYIFSTLGTVTDIQLSLLNHGSSNAMTPPWVKYTYTYADFADPATTKVLTLPVVLGPDELIEGIIYDLRIGFDGGGVTNATLFVDPQSGTPATGAMAGIGVLIPIRIGFGIGNSLPTIGPDQITMALQADVPLDTLTAGEIDLYVKKGKMLV